MLMFVSCANFAFHMHICYVSSAVSISYYYTKPKRFVIFVSNVNDRMLYMIACIK